MTTPGPDSIPHPEAEDQDFWLDAVRGKSSDAIGIEMKHWRRKASKWLGPEWKILPRHVARHEAASCRKIVRALNAARKARVRP